MANTKKNRSELKSYFVKNSIPTESNFADLIDGMLNQQEDGILKLPGDPLRITADDRQGLQKVINFYEKIEDANSAWSLQLNPRSDLNDPLTAKAGFCVADGQSMPRLFIDKATGNIGIGTTLTPIAPLDIAQVPRQAKDLPNHPKNIKGLYITGDFGSDSDGIEFRHTNGTQGIGFGYATIYAAGSNPDQVLQLKPKGAGALRVLGKANLSSGNDGNDFNLESSMESGSLTIGSVSKPYGGQNGQVSNLAGLLLQTNGKTEIAVHHAGKRFASLLYYDGGDAPSITIGRNMGTASAWNVTPVSIAGNLKVGGTITPSAGSLESNGILFPKDPFGGSGDAAWLRYYAREGENCTLEIGTSNETKDHIAFMPSGNVGIGINNPVNSLDVSASRGIKLGLEGSGGGQLILTNNKDDNKIFLEAFSKDGTGSAAELLLTGRNSTNVPKITLVADFTTITGSALVGGNLTAASFNGGSFIPSDFSLKKNFSPINHALKNILSLRGFSFDWKDKSRGENREIGIIAQDVEKVFPELVETINDYKSVRYYSLIAVLIEAMKEQQTQIDALTAAINP